MKFQSNALPRRPATVLVADYCSATVLMSMQSGVKHRNAGQHILSSVALFCGIGVFDDFLDFVQTWNRSYERILNILRMYLFSTLQDLALYDRASIICLF